MSDDVPKIDFIFSAAIELESPAERAAYLDRVCASDTELRRRVERLLDAHFGAGNFLDSPAPALDATFAVPASEPAGTIIGPYKLLEQIGEGGMGVVYMAEQTAPIQRKVALKIIKPGMDSRQVIARFEAERQALALMEHPNIAKMLDAGTMASDDGGLAGRPYFVMELVKGVPIIQYCDTHRLTPRERLELFITVCQAVQHAHQKGIIHRDLKPTNILVADYDDKPSAKIIDFGVAKAIGQQLTERTMFTQFGQVVGTIEYMSPEQAKLNQVDIDTRTDIYSLGVLLYELLAGETPFDRQRLQSAAFDEMLRIIREEEPPRPSTRLSSSESLASIAAQRQLEPKKLTTLVSGDLDWIVMRSLEKDRTRRYQTATGLADDIQRYLMDEPIEARQPTRTYRLKKFIRRNQMPCVAFLGVALSLAIGLGVATWMFFGEKQARKRAENAEQLAKSLAGTSQAVVLQFGHSLWQMGNMLSSGTQRNDAEQILTEAVTVFEQAAKDFPAYRFFRQEKAASETRLGEFLEASGRRDQARNHFRTAIEEYAALANDFSGSAFYIQEQAYANLCIGNSLLNEGKRDAASQLFHDAAILQRKSAEDGNATAQDRLGSQYLMGQGVDKNPVEALKWFRLAAAQNSPLAQASLGLMYAYGLGVKPDLVEAAKWYKLAAAQNYPRAEILLGEFYERGRGVAKNAAEATKLYHRAAEHYLKASGASILQDLHNLAWYLANDEMLPLRDPPLAVELAEKAIAIAPNDGANWNTLGAAQYRDGNWHAAIVALNKSVDMRGGGDAYDCLFLAMAHQQLGNPKEARQWYDKGINWIKKNDPANEDLRRLQDEALKTLGIEDIERLIAGQLAAGHFREAVDASRHEVELWKRTFDERPQESANRIQLVHGNLLFAKSLLAANEVDKAEEILRDVIGLIEAKPADFTNEPSERVEVGHLLLQVGDARLSMNKNQDARKSYNRALKGFQSLRTDYPKEQIYRQEVALSYRKLADVDAASGNFADSESNLRQAMNLYEGLVAEAPESFYYKQETQYCYNLLAIRLKDEQQIQPAIEACRRVAELDQEMLKTSTTVNDTWAVGVDSERLGQTWREVGQLDEAERTLLTAVDLWTKLVDRTNAEDHRFHLGRAYEELGHVYKAQHRLEKASETYGRAQDVWTKLVAEFNHPDRKAHLLLTQEWIIEVLILQAEQADSDTEMTEEKRKAKAKEFRSRALSVLDDSIGTGEWTNDTAWRLATGPDPLRRDPLFAVEFAKRAVEHASDDRKATFLNTLGVAQYRAGNWQEAISALEESLKLEPNKIAGYSDFFLAMALRKIGKVDESHQWYNKGVEWTKNNDPKNEELQRIQDEASKTLGAWIRNRRMNSETRA